MSAEVELAAAFERVASAGVARRRLRARWDQHTVVCRTCAENNPKWPCCPDGRTMIDTFAALSSSIDAASDFILVIAPDFGADEETLTEREVARPPRPLDDQHPISREFIAMSQELLRGAAAGTLKTYEDILAADGITDAGAREALYGIIQNGVETTREQSAKRGNPAQAVGDCLLSGIRLGIRLVRRGVL